MKKVHLEYITSSLIFETRNTPEQCRRYTMFIPVMFGLYFALIGLIAYDEYQNVHDH